MRFGSWLEPSGLCWTSAMCRPTADGLLVCAGVFRVQFSTCGGACGEAEIPTGGEGDKTRCVYFVAVLVPWNSVQQGVKP